MRTFEDVCRLIGAIRPSAGFIRVPDCRISQLRATLGEPTQVRFSERHVVVTYRLDHESAMIIGKRGVDGDDDLLTEGWIVRA